MNCEVYVSTHLIIHLSTYKSLSIYRFRIIFLSFLKINILIFFLTFHFEAKFCKYLVRCHTLSHVVTRCHTSSHVHLSRQIIKKINKKLQQRIFLAQNSHKVQFFMILEIKKKEKFQLEPCGRDKSFAENLFIQS